MLQTRDAARCLVATPDLAGGHLARSAESADVQVYRDRMDLYRRSALFGSEAIEFVRSIS